MMLRLLFLSLILTAKVVRSNDGEGSGQNTDDDERGDEDDEQRVIPLHKGGISTGAESTKGEIPEIDDGSTIIIIIAAASVVALAILAVIAVFFFKRHLQNREQGVYTVPMEQGHKDV